MTDLSAYRALVARKAAVVPPSGMVNVPTLNSHLFPFQRELTERALNRGRSAIFAGTGLGKTLMQLSWGAAVYRETRKPVLDLTPLAVAEQTVEQAEIFDIEGVEYAAEDGNLPCIPVTNYDRIEKFDFDQFGGVILDESSIIKSHDGKTRRALMEKCARIPFRLCCTATPAPNDYVKLGQHAEFLGVMTAKEMLSEFFVHDGSIRATNVGNKHAKPVADWRLKRHAETDFWKWVASWATLVRKPSDLGYSDDGYELPPLRKHQITVPVVYRSEGTLFPMQANTLQERLRARRDSVEGRCRAVADLVLSHPGRQWLIWCHLNKEEDRLRELLPKAVAVRGTDDRETKAQRLLGFAHGNIETLITKPSIGGFGMNWQNCHAMTFVGLNDSFEQIYQAIRRCWRFGQKNAVDAYMVASELEGAVVANVNEKEAAFERMSEALAAQVRAFQRPRPQLVQNHQSFEVPAWLN